MNDKREIKLMAVNMLYHVLPLFTYGHFSLDKRKELLFAMSKEYINDAGIEIDKDEIFELYEYVKKMHETYFVGLSFDKVIREKMIEVIKSGGK